MIFFEEGHLKVTLEAATTPVGRRSMISFAKDGPERKAAGCFRPRALGISSLIILPDPTSRPLLTDIIGTSGGSTSYRGMCSSRRCDKDKLRHSFRRATFTVQADNTQRRLQEKKRLTAMLSRNLRLCCTGTA